MALHAVHRQAEIGERSAVEVLILGLLDQFIGKGITGSWPLPLQAGRLLPLDTLWSHPVQF